jgi:hypothetical protein
VLNRRIFFVKPFECLLVLNQFGLPIGNGFLRLTEINANACNAFATRSIFVGITIRQNLLKSNFRTFFKFKVIT